MITIIAGGRDEHLSPNDKKYLIDLVHQGVLTELVSGMALGIDSESYDLLKPFIPVHPYPALWDDLSVIPCDIKYTKQGKPYNRLAGSQRNRKMAENAEGVILFEGGTGTNNMCKIAKELGLEIIDDFRELLY